MRTINVPVAVFEAMLAALADHPVLLSLAAKFEADQGLVPSAPDQPLRDVAELTAMQLRTYAAQLAYGPQALLQRRLRPA